MNQLQATGQTPSSLSVISSRISVAVDRLLAHLRGGSTNDNNELYRLCLSLSRCIDYAVAKNEIPERALDLPYLVKQVSQWRKDTCLHAAIMVLMISVKGACRNGWFSEKENEELHILYDEIATVFCSARDKNSGEITIHHSISSVMSRFYPRMKMGEILAFVEATPGHGAFLKDFHIATNRKSPEEKIFLFVAQTDNTKTSSCIISPQLVNILLNGKPVDRRTCVYQDPGPQFPTFVTHLLKYGTNFLQAVGQFNGKYVIVIAFMSMVSTPSSSALPDYVPAAATAASDSDNDLIEGPSRISLNCPISFRRIKIPVKGHLCKHLQCFDFDNYVGINSRRPSWRCPHCNQSVCFTDIRVDRYMVKVLEGVDVNISHVQISADGSWEAVIECDDHADTLHDEPLLHPESTPFLDTTGRILDLTDGDNNMDANNSPNQENEKKSSPAQLQDPFTTNNQIPRHMNINTICRNVAPHTESWFSRVHLPTLENRTSNTRSDVTMMVPVINSFPNVISQGQTQISVSNNMQLPTHAIRTSSTCLNPIFQGQSQFPASNNTQFQQQYSCHTSNDYGRRYPAPTTHVTRIPIAIQALPAQTSAGMASDNRQQQFSTFQMEHFQRMSMILDSVSQNMDSQNLVHHDGSNVSSQQFGAHSGPPPQSAGSLFNSHQHQAVNNLALSPSQFSSQVRQESVGLSSGLTSNHQVHRYANATAQQAIQNSSWTAPVPASLQTPPSSMPVTSSEDPRGLGQAFRVQEGPPDAPAEENWRPSGRMRGSLRGQAYSDAFNQFVFQPTQPIQATNPLVLNTPRPVLPPHLQVLLANNINANGIQDSGGSVLDGGGGPGVLPGN